MPRTQLTSIFEGQPLRTRPFPSKTRVTWVLGGVIYHLQLGGPLSITAVLSTKHVDLAGEVGKPKVCPS